MPRKQIKMREDHHQYIKDSPIALSVLVRNALDDAMAGDRELPDRDSRDTDGVELTRTTVAIDDDHAQFIDDEGFTFSVFLHDVVRERIEYERKLDELGE